MQIRHLEILEAIVQTGTFSEAAKKLYITQSAVSHAISELEHQTGMVLFDRLPRGVRLTPYGTLLLDEAQRLLTSFRAFEQRMSHVEDKIPIQIASSITIASFYLPNVLKNVKQRMPKQRIQVTVVPATQAMETLLNGDVDIALIEGVAPQGLFCSRVFGSYRLLAVCANDFPLQKQVVTPEEFCTLPLLLREKGSAIRDTFDSALYLARQKPFPLWESVNSNALIKAVEAGLGVSVLPEVLITEGLSQNRLRKIEITNIVMENKMLVVYHKDKHITHSLQVLLDAFTSL